MKRIAFSLLAFLAITYLLPGSRENNRDDEWEYHVRKYARIYKIVKENYPRDFNKEELFFSSIDGLLRALDPHSYFMDPLAMRSMTEDQQGNYYGIGTRVTKYEDNLTVVAPMEGSPAYREGILPGDVIVEIDGRSTARMSLDEAMKKLRGAKGTVVELKIKRLGASELLAFSLRRAEIPLDSISYAVTHPLAEKIGYINIRTFGGTTAAELEKKLEELITRDHIEGLILDLRWNVGGALFAAVDIADLFLEKGKLIVSIKGRKVRQDFPARKNGQYEHLPVAILLNRVSASASEILAAALQEHKRGLVVGTRSWGKGLVQTVFRLSLNTSLALTTARYFTPKNRCLQRDFSRIDDYYSILSQEDYDTDTSIEGGVIPDILVQQEEPHDLIMDFVSRGVFFKFSRYLIDSGYEIGKDFKADKRVIKKFKYFLEKNDIKSDEKQFKDAIVTIGERIEREVLTNKFSSSVGIKVYLRSDPVSARAAAILKKE